eukprot:Unigene4479_Nuclearia_a/m.13690 Unigene4479_Nuclearia_a/g.13690  ORF Unigene4479_Nuclearia_a/g.13690 Unigene4479_Nuclearia_a/m.13690 type:complete len:521 (-) Unigene4479_Nuclearia_a:1533-3095(-)
MLSAALSNAFFLSFWMRLISSRARPSSTSADSLTQSSTTVRSPSLLHSSVVEPPRSYSLRISTSSAVSLCAPICSEPSSSCSLRTSAVVSARTRAVTSFRSLPRRLPSTGRLGSARSTSLKPLWALEHVNRRTLSSRTMYDSSARRSDSTCGSWWITIASLSGVLIGRLRRSRLTRPRLITRCMSDTARSIASSKYDSFTSEEREVHRLVVGRVGQGAPQVLVHVLGEERRERRHHAAQGQQALVQRAQRVQAVLRAVHALEPRAVQPHVPVGQVLDEPHEPRHDRVQPVRAHLLVHKLDQRLRRREQPPVHRVRHVDRAVRVILELVRRLQLEAVHVLHKEAVRVEPRQEHVLNHVLHALLLEPQRLGAHDGRVDQVQPQRVGAVLVQDLARVRVVLEALGHLLAVRGQDEAVDDQVAERRLVKQRGRNDEQRVEPPARLVKALGDEVGGEGRLKLGAVLERVVLLGVGHAARLEPAVKNLLHAPQIALAHLGRDRDVVDALAVQVGHAHARELFEVLD